LRQSPDLGSYAPPTTDRGYPQVYGVST
jgi:hypothetical protein